MNSIPDFSAKDCLKALERLGFTIDFSKGKGGHVKAYAPETATVRKGQQFDGKSILFSSALAHAPAQVFQIDKFSRVWEDVKNR